jgi:signal transduction histidine kinase
MAGSPDASATRDAGDRREAGRDGPELGYPLVERRRAGGTESWDGVERRQSPSLTRAPAAPPPPPLLGPFRWAALVIGFVLGVQELSQPDWGVIVAGLVLVAVTVWRTLQPVALEGQAASGWILLDAALATAIVLLSGAWGSPWVLALAPPAVAAGFARGSTFAVEQSAGVIAVVSVAWFVGADDWGDHLDLAVLLASGLVAVAVLAGFAGRLSRESARQQSLALSQVGRLTEANGLLVSLHRVAQTLPASLDLDDVLDSTVGRLRELVTSDSVTIFLHEEDEDTWVPARRAGNREQAPLTPSTFPPPLVRATTELSTVSEPDLVASGGPGVSPRAASGLYAALRARGAVVGMLAVEATTPRKFSSRETGLINGLVEPLGVAIDNARLFGRLRTIGADEERNRIARDLHDRLGQSIAWLAFELDRAVRAAERGDNTRELLETLRTEVRSVLRTLRETLYDLRTDVRDDQDLGVTMEHFLDRVRERSKLEIDFQLDQEGRLPLLQEKELWRIAKEAVINAERHAKASRLDIGWRCDGRSAKLVVQDDGVGFARSSGRIDSYGILGMRERAASLGAWFDIESAPGRGTTVTVVLAPD